MVLDFFFFVSLYKDSKSLNPSSDKLGFYTKTKDINFTTDYLKSVMYRKFSDESVNLTSNLLNYRQLQTLNIKQ